MSAFDKAPARIYIALLVNSRDHTPNTYYLDPTN